METQTTAEALATTSIAIAKEIKPGELIGEVCCRVRVCAKTTGLSKDYVSQHCDEILINEALQRISKHRVILECKVDPTTIRY